MHDAVIGHTANEASVAIFSFSSTSSVGREHRKGRGKKKKKKLAAKGFRKSQTHQIPSISEFIFDAMVSG